MFVGKTRNILTTIRLGWKGLPGTNSLAYYENPSITTVKSFVGMAPGLTERLDNVALDKMSVDKIASRQNVTAQFSFFKTWSM